MHFALGIIIKGLLASLNKSWGAVVSRRPSERGGGGCDVNVQQGGSGK